MADFFTVTESFVGNLDGTEVEYHQGDVVPASDPAVKKMPLHFAPLVISGGGQPRTVEQATAAPGEKRRIYQRKPKAAPAGKALTTDSLKGK